MKRLEISTLMDAYQDNEFFPEGGSAADARAVKDMVLAQAAPAKKRRVPPLARVLLAAALAVGCLTLSVMAGLPQRVYGLIVGGSMVVTPLEDQYGEHGFEFHFTDRDWEAPIALEDGRLWLTVDGERTDVTDLIDGETPYIVTRFFPETNSTVHLVVGGTPERFGYMQYLETGEDGDPLALCEDGRPCLTSWTSSTYRQWLFIDGHGHPEETFTDQDWELVERLNADFSRKLELERKYYHHDATEEERLELTRINNNNDALLADEYAPWVVNAQKQLGYEPRPWGFCVGGNSYQDMLFYQLSQQKGENFSLEDMETVARGEWDPLLFSN